jgi:beta-lysine 5,6-aminomutase beta subunit
MKGFAGDYGLERYQWLDARNLGAQIQNEELLRLAVHEKADAILVSKVVTQHNIHIRDMKDLMQKAEKLGLREKVIFCAGGPRVTHPMALECGFDAGFGVGTKPSDVVSYVVEEYLKRNKPEALAALGLAPEPKKPRVPSRVRRPAAKAGKKRKKR